MFNNTLTIGSTSFERLNTGRWIDGSSTGDEPRFFILKSRIKDTGDSEFLVRYERSENAAVPTSPDKRLIVHVSIKGDIKTFTSTDVIQALATVNTFASSEANLLRLMRGEL